VEATFRLGRVAGVEIGIHWTWVLIVGLLSWSLGAAVFPDSNPGLSDGTYVAMAAVAVPAFFACLLAHELGHAVEARRLGMAIQGITLWVFGGVAMFRGRFPSARAELRIALAGPAVSLVLGVVMLGVATAAPLPSAVDGVLTWLGSINLLLLAFNMIPALPLDGGRVLHALLWRRRGDVLSATEGAAALGRGFGRVMIFGGLALALLTASFGGIWLALIGWFVLAAANAEAVTAERAEALSGLRVADAMTPDPVVVPVRLTGTAFLEAVFARSRHAAYPVIDGERPVGLVSFRAVRRGDPDVAADMEPLERCTVLDPDGPLDEALEALATAPLRRALVVRDDRLVGILVPADVLRLLEARLPRPPSRGSTTPARRDPTRSARPPGPAGAPRT
jgi:Zn-dependent protease/CBS domain-containing protein